MTNTHTKLLAGAFSVLSIAQFFMVSNLANQFNQYTENATASIVAAAPMHMRLVRTKTMYKSALTERDLAKIKFAQKQHAAAGTEESTTDEATPTGMKIMTLPNRRQGLVNLKKPAATSSEQIEAVTTDAQ